MCMTGEETKSDVFHENLRVIRQLDKLTTSHQMMQIITNIVTITEHQEQRTEFPKSQRPGGCDLVNFVNHKVQSLK